ncbi:MAG: histidine kinase [Bacteroidota bacterium]
MKSNKTMIWATSIIGVVLYFLLLLYFRFLLTAQGAGFFPKLVQEFLFNLPVLLINIFLIFKVVRLFNRFFPSKIYLRLVVEIFAIFFITALLVFATGVLLELTQNINGFVLKEHINIFGDTFVMALLIGVFTLTILEIHFQVRASNEKEIENEQLNRENLSLKYIQLKNQINPHFLFNSLSILSALVKSNQDNAQLFIQNLSEIYRYVLFQDQKDLVPLKQELEFITSFIEILRFRYDEGLQVTIDIKEAALSKGIIPMTLQLLIENAVKHNIVDENSPLVIDIKSEGNNLIICNNLNKKIVISKGSKIGLNMIRKRYKIVNSSEIMVTNESDRFVVKIPLI